MSEIIKRWKTYDQAISPTQIAYVEALATYYKACDIYIQARKTCAKTKEDCKKAWEANEKAKNRAENLL